MRIRLRDKDAFIAMVIGQNDLMSDALRKLSLKSRCPNYIREVLEKIG